MPAGLVQMVVHTGDDAPVNTLVHSSNASLSGDLSGVMHLYDDTNTDALGLVAANPAANTILGRLKAIVTALTGLVLGAGENFIGFVGGKILTPSATFTRMANTTAYVVGQLVANHTTAGSVAPMSWVVTRIAAGSSSLRRLRLRKSGTGIVAASFRCHFYTASPTPTNGDGAAWLTTMSGYLGSIDITIDKVFSDGAAGNGVPIVGSEINFVLASGSTIYGLLEARGAYTPASGEVFTAELELQAS